MGKADRLQIEFENLKGDLRKIENELAWDFKDFDEEPCWRTPLTVEQRVELEKKREEILTELEQYKINIPAAKLQDSRAKKIKNLPIIKIFYSLFKNG